MTQAEIQVLSDEADCNSGTKNNNLIYFKRKKHMMILNLFKDMKGLNCTSTNNTGCNSKQVLSRMSKFNKSYLKLSNDVKSWQNQGYVQTPTLCTRLHLR